MSFGSFQSGGSNQPMADINTTPLVDVMLVLLVIFIITAPLFHQAVSVELPRAQAGKLEEKPQVLSVSIDAQNHITVNGAAIEEKDLPDRLALASAGEGLHEMHLWADRNTRYERVTQVMATAQKAGIKKIAFVTERTK